MHDAKEPTTKETLFKLVKYKMEEISIRKKAKKIMNP